MDNQIFGQKTLELEALIYGLWHNRENGDTWNFSLVPETERMGWVSIADSRTPTPGSLILRYEVIWVNDEKTFIDLIYTSIPKRDQHRVWANENELKIEYFNHNQPEPKYVLLHRV